MKRVSPGVALLFLAPLLGELVSGHMTLLQFISPIYFAILALPYGCGALICRELTRRWHKGWLSMLLLSMAYGIYEEALVARSFFDPKWDELGALAKYDHYAGINWTYSILLVHFHVTISILSSIMLAEMLYPKQRREPWLTNRQLAICGVILGLWLPVLWLLAPYVPPMGLYALACLAIIGLGIAARRVPAQPLPPVDRKLPRPRWFLFMGALNETVIFVTVFLLPEQDLNPPLIVAVIFLLVFDAVTFGLLLHWSGNFLGWDDRHRLALVAGLLAFFVVFGVLSDLEKFKGASLVSLGTIIALRKLSRRIKERSQPAPELTGLPA